jgi:hypothetical protein
VPSRIGDQQHGSVLPDINRDHRRRHNRRTIDRHNPVKRRVKKGIKRVKSAPPEAYLAGAGVLVGGAAVVLLATTKSGRELLIRTAQLTLSPEADEPESQESDAREDVDNEPAEDADAEGEPEEDTNGDADSGVTDLKPRDQRPRSAAPGRHPRRPRKAAAPVES